MTDKELITELDDIVNKIRARIIYYKTENSELKKRIIELKKIVRNT